MEAIKQKLRDIKTEDLISSLPEVNQSNTQGLKASIENLPARFKDKGFKNYNVNQDNRKQYDLCLKFAKGELKKKSLVLCGNVGNGKTHLAVAIARNLSPIHKDYAHQKPKSSRSYFHTVDEFFMELNDLVYQKHSKIEKMKHYLTNYDLFILDDLGITNLTPSKQENLYVFINRAYNQESRIIVTTNFSLEELEKIDPRIVSRLNEMANIVLFRGEDYRFLNSQNNKGNNETKI